MYFVYLIRNRKTRNFYIGYSEDLKRRIKEHKENNPELIYYEAYKSEADARNRERNLKQRGQAVRRLKEQLKGNDLVGRWDELTIAVVMAKTPKKVVSVIQNRLEQSLKTPISFGVEDADQAELSPILVSEVSENVKDFDTFIGKAEETMHDVEW